ncbi:MAG TPA: aldo/keto reductase [Candidatus Binataceae bacterium]|nr:aldo/keto reductase [Candidatus Binataceae bacterium]
MESKRLGNTVELIPEIGVGVWRYRGGDEPLRAAIEHGAVFIDTAEVYGTEEAVGQAIRGIRDRVFLASKVSGQHLRHDDVIKAAEASLQRLNTDRIDLYQIHWPTSVAPIQETMAAMETLVDRGLVRHIGVSNFSVAHMRTALNAMTKYPIVANQVLYSLHRREIEAELIPYCEANNVTIIAYTPLDNGNLARGSEYPTNPKGMAALRLIANRRGKTLGQVALNWCTAHNGVVAIPKSDKVERVIENCGASGWRLSSDEMRALNDAFTREPDEDWD